MEARSFEYYYEEIEEDIVVPKKRIKKRKKNLNRQYNKTKTINRAQTKSAINAKKLIISIYGIVNLLLIAITLYGYITLSNASLEITQIKSDITEMETIRDQYKMEIAKYSSSERIEEIAKYNLGMSYPEENQFYYLSNKNNYDNIDSKDKNEELLLAGVKDKTEYEKE
ncbi:septum formation initiator family protein [Miniphocaeibacter halophilus]|uniref:Septum formation initiator family protein n=1 Tax=Miniphocaeibacter halophilus TaxID=2931922 RepID=A0AC61MPN5_9FIRM|nr:septum formation initiator family protein [Miniphocaeibacter halophilus]QQK07506.1 septum formation initiator family protein [Miniphocaeibacter halophilus]